MILGVCHIKIRAIQRQALRLVELCRVECAIGEAARASADHRLHFIRRQIGDDDAMMIGIGDEQAIEAIRN